jgi:hypothetical protein
MQQEARSPRIHNQLYELSISMGTDVAAKTTGHEWCDPTACIHLIPCTSVPCKFLHLPSEHIPTESRTTRQAQETRPGRQHHQPRYHVHQVHPTFLLARPRLWEGRLLAGPQRFQKDKEGALRPSLSVTTTRQPLRWRWKPTRM